MENLVGLRRGLLAGFFKGFSPVASHRLVDAISFDREVFDHQHLDLHR